MPSPFPGMDPYLEAYWGDIHANLATYVRDHLAPQLPRGLFARVEEYLALESDDEEERHHYSPDVKVSERPANGGGTSPAGTAASGVAVAERVFVPLPAEPPTLRSVRIYDHGSGNRIITAIEILSPVNKVGQDGRRAYRRKQRDLLAGEVSLVEIDLLRDGGHVLVPPEWALPPDCRGPYRISVVRSWQPFQAEVYRVPLRFRLPAIGIPLRPTDPDALLDLQPLIGRCYEYGGYEAEIDYRANPVPPLHGDDAVWADALLRDQGKR